MQTSRHRINDVDYHVVDEGDGDRAVLLLHGMPDTSLVWRHQIPVLADAGYRVIVPDMLGYGKTSKPADPARYAGELIVGDLLALLETLGVAQFDVVGHDWGAFASWELAVNCPELVRRHVSISVAHPGVFLSDLSPTSLKQNWYMYLNTQAGAAELYSHNDFQLFLDIIVPSHPEPEELRVRLREPSALDGVLNWDRGNPLADLFLAAARGEIGAEECTVPTLGIWSSDDDYLLEEHMQDSARFMAADWRYERIEDASHWPMLDRPAEVTRLTLDWLQQDSASSAS